MGEAELAKYFLTTKIPYVKPLYSIKLSNDEDVISWFGDADYTLGNYYRPLFREMRDNLALFLGTGVNPNFTSPFAAVFANTSDLYTQPQSLYINELHRVTMDQVSLIISNELVPEVLPHTENYGDKVACNVVKEWLDSMNYTLEIEKWRFRWEVQKKIFGEAFCVVLWNPNIGDLHPDAKMDKEEEFIFRDIDGTPVLDVEGKEVKIKKNLRIGDIELLNPMPWDVLIDPENRYDEANWFMWKEWKDIEYLKKKYPKKKWDVPSNDKRFDPYMGAEKDDPDRRLVYYLFHRATEFMPEGRYIVATKENVLINKPFYDSTLINNQDLPLVRFIDLDVGFGVRGFPILYRNVRNISDAYNGVTNQIYNNLEMESPKLFIHEDAGVDAQKMPNGNVIFEWRGNIKPSVETPTTNTSSIFNFREALKKNIDEASFQNPMVRGDVVNSQMDTFVALQHYEDLRAQLAAPDIKGHIRSMENLFRLMIVRAKDNYRPDDGRMIKILGKHNTFQLKYFDPINLQKADDVKITTSGNLANSKAARSQMMITIKREFPDIISNEFFLDALGLSHSKKFMNAITAAVSSAEAENQNLFDGKDALEPTRYEDLITHWEVHRIPMQTLDFKHSPPEVQDLFIRHVTATEKLMFEQAQESPVFAEKMASLRQFPMFYTPIPIEEGGLPPQIPAQEAPIPIPEEAGSNEPILEEQAITA